MRKIKALGVLALLVVTLVALVVPAMAAPVKSNSHQLAAVDLLLWTKESQDYFTAIDFQGAFDTWAAENAPGSTLTIEFKDVEQLRTELQTVAVAGEGVPDFLWTVSDHAGVYTEAGLIQPLDEMFDVENYASTVVLDGQTWGIPFTVGNHLMLMYNKTFVETPPTTIEELYTLAEQIKADNPDVAPLVMNETEPFGLAPWMQAINPDGVPFVGFEADGVTPDVNNESVIASYQLLLDLKEAGVIPDGCDYNCAFGNFKDGIAAMTIMGDWALGEITTALGEENLGLAPFPQFEGGQPAPLTSGTYAMIPTLTSGDKLEAVKSFLTWYTTDPEVVLNYSVSQGRLPGYLPIYEDPALAENRLVLESATVFATGVPMPTVAEMRCVWDGLKPPLQAIFSGEQTPEEAAAAAQDYADTCIETLQ